MRIRIALIVLALAASALTQEPKRPPITGVAHISLFVHDIEKSRHFYKDFLGYDEPFKLDKPDGSLALTFIKVNDRQYIELVPETAAGTDRLNHISIETPDANAMRLYLGSRGVKVPDQVPTGRIGNANFNVKDADGHTVEIVQYLPAGWSMREKGKYLGPHRISDRMAHLGITVANLDAATQFYLRPARLPGDLARQQGRQDPQLGERQGPRWRRLPGIHVGETARNASAPSITSASSSPISKRPSATWSPVPPVRTTIAQLTIATGVNHKHQCNLYDPDGTRVEMMEPNTVDGKPVPPSPAPPPVRN